MRNISGFLILYIVLLNFNLQCRNIPKNLLKDFRLTDGSLIKGTIAHDEAYSDTITIKNESLGYIKIPRRELKHQDTNYNEGLMFSFSPYLVGEGNGAFDKGSDFSLSSSKSSDENLAISFDFDYFNRNFDKFSS